MKEKSIPAIIESCKKFQIYYNEIIKYAKKTISMINENSKVNNALVSTCMHFKEQIPPNHVLSTQAKQLIEWLEELYQTPGVKTNELELNNNWYFARQVFKDGTSVNVSIITEDNGHIRILKDSRIRDTKCHVLTHQWVKDSRLELTVAGIIDRDNRFTRDVDFSEVTKERADQTLGNLNKFLCHSKSAQNINTWK
jgi:hypothetical protein